MSCIHHFLACAEMQQILCENLHADQNKHFFDFAETRLSYSGAFISGIINTFTVSVSVVICAQVPEPESPDLFSSSASLLS